MSSWTGIPELREGYRQLGALRFWLIIVGVLLYIAAFAWLGVNAAWPPDCHPRARQTFMLFWCSPTLLHGGWVELTLFAVIWALPVGAAVYVILHRRRRRGSL